MAAWPLLFCSSDLIEIAMASFHYTVINAVLAGGTRALLCFYWNRIHRRCGRSGEYSPVYVNADNADILIE